ncbi:retropepsin-like aspartic protease family protein [Loktanella sp. S4079]|uniref:retropepsin-like aspartic protease family protein n=1 Tax=Loktanella sp. S4079 TaxID=579483 RepID=UPI0005F9FDEC|nr:TIGR02281 family clan AA aspartic protease [Loktanella sp. S4079]KJZ20252.1 aspartyl protease [Loktanella sp. S4079]
MTADQTARLIYLSLLVLAVLGSAVVSGRENLGKTVQQAAIWLFIFLGVIGAYGLWEDIQRDTTNRQAYLADGRIEVPRSPDGHYYMTLEVNNRPLTFVVDTGASQIVLSQEDARHIGLDPDNLDYWGYAMTANGEVRTAAVILESITLGNVIDRNVNAVVNGGEIDISLLGMTYLNRFNHIEISNNQLILSR